MAIVTLALATLPSLGTAVGLWWRLHAPSMAFATFAALSGLVMNIYFIIEPSGVSAVDVIKWWFFSFGK